MSGNSVFCGLCGTETFSSARFCVKCGAALPATKVARRTPTNPPAPAAAPGHVKPRVPTLRDLDVSDSWPAPSESRPAASPAQPAGTNDSSPQAHGAAEGKTEQTMNNEDRPNEKRTIIEEGTRFRGSLSSSCPVDVRGRIDGEIETPALTVSATGAVHGQARVGSVRSEGELSGDFDADTVELAGVVKNNTIIRARSLEVKLSAERGKLQVIFGESEAMAENALGTPDVPGAGVSPDVAGSMGIEESTLGSSSDYLDPSKSRRKRRNGEPERPAGSRHSDPPPAAG